MKNQDWNLPAGIAKAVELTGNDKVLYAYLRSCPDIAGEPNVRAMSIECGVDHTTTLKAIKNLEYYGLIKVKRSNAAKLPRLIEIRVLKRASIVVPTTKKTTKKTAKKVAKKTAKKKGTKKRARR